MFKDEKNIILELKKGNEKAFNIIYHEYYKLIFYIIYNMVYDYELANDLTTDTFINKIGRYWDNKTVEIDIVGSNEDRNIALFGECKYSKHKVGLNILYELENKVKKVNELNKYYVLFSISGFSDDLISLSKYRNDLFLIEGIEEYKNF